MKIPGGTQCIRTLDGYVLPLDIINGLPYLKMTPNTDEEARTLPHIILTSGDKWDPRVLDHMLSDQPDWYNTLKELEDGLISSPFHEYGIYHHRQVPEFTHILPDNESSTTALRAAFADLTNLNQPFVGVDSHMSCVDTSRPDYTYDCFDSKV